MHAFKNDTQVYYLCCMLLEIMHLNYAIQIVVDVEVHPNPNLISSPFNQMSHLTIMPTKTFHY